MSGGYLLRNWGSWLGGWLNIELFLGVLILWITGLGKS